MARTPLDPQTADRLLSGRVGADDLPPGFDRVAAVLEAARRSTTDGDFSRLEATVAAMSAAVSPTSGIETSRGRVRSLRGKLAVGSVAGLVSLFGGLAAAGALPSAAQDGLATAVSHVGIDLPQHGNGHGHNGNDATTPPAADKSHGKAGEHNADGTSDNAGSNQQPDNHGACVSAVAHSTTTTTPTEGNNGHGAAVSAAAQSDCGKPDQSQNPAANAQDNKPQTPDHPSPAPQSEDHGKPADTPTSLPPAADNGHGPPNGTPGSQGATHGNGH